MRKIFLTAISALALLYGTANAQTPEKNSVLETMVISAAASMQSGDIETAVNHLEYLDRHFPGNDAVNYYLGICYAAKGKLPEAEARMRAAVQADSTNVWYQDYLASILLSEGKNVEGGRIYLDLMEKYPAKYTNAYTLTLLGNSNLSQYRDSLALKNFEDALAISPDYVPAILGQGEAFRMMGNYPGFFASVNTMVSNPDLNQKAKSDYVSELLQHIDYKFYTVWKDQLDSLVNTCAKVHPGDSSCLMLAGYWYYGTDRKGKGREYFDEYLSYHPEDLNAHYIHLQMLMDEGSTAREIIDECEEIVRIGGEKNPKVTPALATIGDTYYHVGQSKNAYKAYDRALKANPGYLPVLNNYAYYLSLEGKKLKKAESMSKITVDKDPDNPTYLDTYGWILYLRGQPQKAKPVFKHAMLYGGRDSSVITEHYARVLEALGEDDLAKSFYLLSESRKKDGK